MDETFDSSLDSMDYSIPDSSLDLQLDESDFDVSGGFDVGNYETAPEIGEMTIEPEISGELPHVDPVDSTEWDQLTELPSFEEHMETDIDSIMDEAPDPESFDSMDDELSLDMDSIDGISDEQMIEDIGIEDMEEGQISDIEENVDFIPGDAIDGEPMDVSISEMTEEEAESFDQFIIDEGEQDIGIEDTGEWEIYDSEGNVDLVPGDAVDAEPMDVSIPEMTEEEAESFDQFTVDEGTPDTGMVDMEEGQIYDIQENADLVPGDAIDDYSIEESNPSEGLGPEASVENEISSGEVIDNSGAVDNLSGDIESVPEGNDVIESLPREYDAFEQTVLEDKPGFYETGSFYEQGINEFGYTGTCGPTSQANALNELFDTNEFTENKVLNVAVENNLCEVNGSPEVCGGTDTNQFLELYDKMNEQLDGKINTEVYEFNNALDVEDVAAKLDEGCVLNVAVDANGLWDQPREYVNSMGLPCDDFISDHWITVTGVQRDELGNIQGFDIIDSGGGVDYVDADKYHDICFGTEEHKVIDPTAIVISRNDTHAV